jgi:hypothetical protein
MTRHDAAMTWFQQWWVRGGERWIRICRDRVAASKLAIGDLETRDTASYRIFLSRKEITSEKKLMKSAPVQIKNHLIPPGHIIRLRILFVWMKQDFERYGDIEPCGSFFFSSP